MQQACEKLIKIQLYKSNVVLNNKNMYNHNIPNLINYAKVLGVPLIIPGDILKYSKHITDWEAESRYDIHFSVRIDRIEFIYQKVSAWYNQLYKLGYR